MSTKLAPDQIAIYRAAALRQREKRLTAVTERRERALQLAREAAKLLRERFGATRVVLFGSLLHPYSFTEWSDVDLAAWGIDPKETFTAIYDLFCLDAEIEVNLVDVNCCKPRILAIIAKDGRDL
jgi:predicted nucleotidyltransferase